MVYSLQTALDCMNIAEREFGIGKEIRFKFYEKGLSVIAKIKGKEEVIGINLVHESKDGDPFEDFYVEMVTEILKENNYDPGKTLLIGQKDHWHDHMNMAYTEIMRCINPWDMIQANSQYGAKVAGEEIVPVL